MRTIKTKKQNYLKPTVSVCNVMEESYILTASPNVQPGGGQGGSVTVEPPTPVVGDDNDELIG
ncbi:hypothetical protein [Prevotella jejuni]